MIDDSDEHKAELISEVKKSERLNSDGLCLECESSPQNPAVDSNLCLECFKDSPHCCNAEGCINGVSGMIDGYYMCETHLVDTIHKEYRDYLQQKSELDDKEKELMEKAKVARIKEFTWLMDTKEMSDHQHELYREWCKIERTRRHLEAQKTDIKQAMKSADTVFPEGYSETIN